MKFDNIDKLLHHYASEIQTNGRNTIDIHKSMDAHFNDLNNRSVGDHIDIHSTDNTKGTSSIEREKKINITLDVINLKRREIPTETDYEELLCVFSLCHDTSIDYNKYNEIIRKASLKIRPYCNNKFVQAMRDDNGCVSIEYILRLVYRHIQLSRYSLDLLEYSIRSTTNQRNNMTYIHESELETYFYDLISGNTSSTEMYYSIGSVSQSQHPLGIINMCLTEDFKPYYILIVVGLLFFHQNNSMYTKRLNIEKCVHSSIMSEWYKFCECSYKYIKMLNEVEQDQSEEDDDDYNFEKEQSLSYDEKLEYLIYEFKLETMNSPFSIHKAYQIYESYLNSDVDGDGVISINDFSQFAGFSQVPPLDAPLFEAPTTLKNKFIDRKKKESSIVNKVINERLTHNPFLNSPYYRNSRGKPVVNIGSNVQPTALTIHMYNNPSIDIVFTPVFIEQLFDCGHIAYPAVGMDFREFLQFYFAFKYKKSTASHQYFWRVLMNASLTVPPMELHTNAKNLDSKISTTDELITLKTTNTNKNRSKRLTPAIICFFYRDVLRKFSEVFGTVDGNGYAIPQPPPSDQIVTEIYDVLGYKCDYENIPTGVDPGAVIPVFGEYTGPTFVEFCSSHDMTSNTTISKGHSNRLHQGHVCISMLIDLVSFKNYEDRESVGSLDPPLPVDPDEIIENNHYDNDVLYTIASGEGHILPQKEELRSHQYESIPNRAYTAI